MLNVYCYIKNMKLVKYCNIFIFVKTNTMIINMCYKLN